MSITKEHSLKDKGKELTEINARDETRKVNIAPIRQVENRVDINDPEHDGDGTELPTELVGRLKLPS